jgi:hypothetical protein
MLTGMSAESPKPPTSTASPIVTDFRWGRIQLGTDLEFKDVKLWPGAARAWDWDETGTRHQPGVQVADVEELVESGAEIIVLSRGVDLRLHVMTETLAWLEARGIAVEVLQSEAAVARYNELAATRRVGALIHSTC